MTPDLIKKVEGLEPDHDHDFDDMADEYCPNCGGEGVVYSCFSEYACIDHEGGCDLCERLCDWCRPRLRALEARDRT